MDVFGYNILATDQTGPAVQSAVAGSTKLEAAQTRVVAAMKTGSREMTMLASGLTHLGMTAMLATPYLGEFGKGIGEAGLVLATLGSGINMVVPLLQTMKVVLYGDLIPAVLAYTAALWEAYAAEIVVTGGIALALGAIAGWYLLNQKTAGVQDSLNSAVNTGTGEMGDYRDTVKDTVYWTDRLKGLSQDLAGAELEASEAILDQKDAQVTYDNAAYGSTEKARAFIALQRANLRVQETSANVAALAPGYAEAQAQVEEGQAIAAGMALIPSSPYAQPPIGQGGPNIYNPSIAAQMAAGTTIIQIQGDVNLAPGETVQGWIDNENRDKRIQRGIPT
jgi:hypothetical protein